jgi:hypothetical protein
MNPFPLKLLYFFIPLFFLAGLVACQRNNMAAPPSANDSVTIYVLGTSGNSVVYWKNGTPFVLGPNYKSYASGMVLAGNDLYISGGHRITDTTSAVQYWKNGIGTDLPDTTGRVKADGIFVSGSKVYVAGTMRYYDNSTTPYTGPTASYPKWGDVAVCWKNGLPVLLPGNSFFNFYQGFVTGVYADYVSGIFVSGTDVYVAGGSGQYQVQTPSTYNFAGYWKNGIFTALPGFLDSTSAQFAYFPETSSIYVSGDDVYVTGFLGGSASADLINKAIFWKNGIPTVLNTSPGTYAEVRATVVVGNDTYMVGAFGANYAKDREYHAAYWKNGVPVILDSSNNPSYAISIFVIGNDVYAAGEITINGNAYPTYWRNGVATRLGGGAIGGANSIVVQKN